MAWSLARCAFLHHEKAREQAALLEILSEITRNQKNSGSRVLPELARMVKRAKEIALLAAGEQAHGAEPGGDDALIPGRIGAGWACALRLVERDRLPFECGFDARVEHLDRETEAWHGVPIGVRADGPEVEARIASTGNNDGLDDTDAAAAERSAVDDRVVVADLAVGAEHRAREIGQPEVLVAKARRPGRGQLQLTAVDVDRIRNEAECDHVAGAK